MRPIDTRSRQWGRQWGRQPARQQQARSSQRGFWLGLLAGAVVGGLAMFVLDPRTGRRRRALARDQVVRLGNTVDELVSETIPQKVDYLSGFAKGARHRAMHVIGRDGEPMPDDDQFITDRVMSIVFRDPDLPKGNININTVDRVVYLRGSVDDPSMVQEIEARVRRVEGVRDVVNVINRPEVDPSVIRAEEARRAEEEV